MASNVDPQVEKLTKDFRQLFDGVRTEIEKAIVGHREIVEGVLTCLFVGGHALLEGVPGLGKTYLIRSLAEVLSLDFSRIQFTPDLMPADILGTNMLVEDQGTGKRHFSFQKGPVFAQLVLADEINRATPKTQSAMLEAMQEHTVTVAGQRYALQQPFFVMATQNPIEQEGTYPLPEAQLDRFFFKLVVSYSSKEELGEIINRTTTGFKPDLKAVMKGETIINAQKLIRRIIMAPHVQDYALRCVMATHPNGPYSVDATSKYVRWGSSPRGAQAVTLAAKVQAVLDGRYSVSFGDIEKVFLPCLRHRTLLNFEGQAEGIDVDDVLGEILKSTPTMNEAAA
jgi:MoxR-like ATPase